MLYGYPEEAVTGENWLHNCLCEMLESIHHGLDAGEVSKAWPEVIPERYRNKLSDRPGLQDRLNLYIKALRTLDHDDRKRILNAMYDQNKISLLLSCDYECESVDDLPKQIREPATELFKFAFKLLTDLSIRDRYYSKIYYNREDHVCPFCGCERFTAPGGPRVALDHYLNESRYPFAAANLRNLIPMGHECNSKHKLAQDILRTNQGKRRKAIDPYRHLGVRISLDNSRPFAGRNGVIPLWQIEFEPNTQEVETWEHVFRIQERYKRDELDPSFNSWLREFSSWCKYSNVTYEIDEALVDAIERYANHMENSGISDRAFLKAAVFRMLHKHCKQGHKRLFNLIKGIVIGAVLQNLRGPSYRGDPRTPTPTRTS